MEIRIKLPPGSRSVAADIDLARSAAEAAVRQSRGLLPAGSLPAHSHNPCDEEGCLFLGVVVFEGDSWMLYDCNGVLTYYKL